MTADPNSGPAAQKTFTTSLSVRSSELDSFGHVNHAVYLSYFEQARFEALDAGGFDLEALRAQGWGIHVVRVEVDYRRELLMGQRIRIRTWLERWRKTSMIIAQQADRGEGTEVVADIRVVAVWIDPDGRPMRVPESARIALGG